jgi:phenylpropionate dioxygenase-like ring-hydroxylating dioxygenase large terminal subunit
MWVRNAWYVAAWAHEITGDGVVARTILNEPLVLYRTGNGLVVAMEDRCCHRLAPLSLGRREGDDLRCMYHGLKFGPDGRCNEIPGQTAIPARAFVRPYPVVESGSWIWVWMGDAARADVSQIPATVAGNDPGWNMRMGCLDYAANYQLINDNLLDLSHVAFVHEKTLGRGTPQWATEQPARIPLDRGVRFQRWFRGRGPSHYFGAPGERFDMWHSYDFIVPGVFIQRPAWYPLGTADRCDGRAPGPEIEPLFVRLDDQAVVPVTERTSRYFYAAGGRAKDATPELAGEIFAFTEVAFHEDKVIIEAQQKVIDQDPARQMLSLAMDGGPNLFRGIVRELIAAETTTSGAVEAARAG